MISHKLKLIFPRIGKTASTSIIDYFKQFDTDLIDEGHDMIVYGINRYLQQFLENKGYDVSNYFRFSVVRNPYDKLVSAWYEYKKPNRFLNMKNEKALSDFSEFVLFAKNKNHPHWKPQYNILYDNNGKCLVNYIAKFEKIETDIKEICELNNIEFIDNFPKNNTSERNHYSLYYDSETKHIVKEKYKKDFEIFEYDF